MLQKNKPLVIIFTFCILLFIVVTLCLNIPDNYNEKYFIYPDANTYINAASHLYNDGFSAHYFRPLGWPIIIGIPHLFVAGEASRETILLFSIFINFICWLTTVYFFYKIIFSLSNNKTATIFSFSFILLLSIFLGVYQAMAENLYILTIVLFAYNLLRYTSYKKDKYLLYSSFFIFYSAIVKPSNYYPAIVALIICIFVFRKNLKAMVSVILLFCFTIGLQLYIMNRTYGKPTISFIQNHTAYNYLFAKTELYSTPTLPTESLDDYCNIRMNRVMAMAAQDSALHHSKSIWPYMDSAYKSENSLTLRKHIVPAIKFGVLDIIENATTGSSLPYLLKKYNNLAIFEFTQKVTVTITRNENALLTFFVFLNWLGIIYLYIFRRSYILTRKFAGIFVFQLLCNYYLFSSGISFWQGDRFNYIYYPLTLTVLCYIIQSLFSRKTSVSE